MSDKPKKIKTQSQSYAEYMALQEKKHNKTPFKSSPYHKYFLGPPLIGIFFLGLFMLPYFLYLLRTSPDKDDIKKRPKTKISAKK